ncbi:hypothetical protein PENTCL1PPCAC_25250, partial [Pristionchus entomophagus]
TTLSYKNQIRMRLYASRLVRISIIALIAILCWSLLLILGFDLTLTANAQLPPPRRFPLRSWIPSKNETIRFKDAPLNFRILRFPGGLTSHCEAGNLTLLVIVQSAPLNGTFREAIRQTWANTDAVSSLTSGSARAVFLIGSGDKASEALIAEIEEKGDIILVDKEDNYNNLVFKTTITLFISQKHCPTPYLLKIDQDMAFNVDRFMEQVGVSFRSDHAAIYGRKHYFTMPRRNKASRWYVSERQYDGWIYPFYCSGGAYVLTSYAVDSLLRKLPEFEIIKIEDVFFTGIVSSAAGVKRIGKDAKFKMEYEPLSFSDSDCPGQALAVHAHKKEEELRKAWIFLSRDC